MKYKNIVKGTFISRPNRFVANVLINGTETSVHVKNTGRCRELLVPDAVVYLENFTDNPGKRKLMYDLIAVEKGNLLINIDSQAPNKVAREAMENGIFVPPDMSRLSVIRPETVYGDSRFDFYVKDKDGREGFVEVKGVTLEEDGAASFPDAPTERGIKHLHELIKARRNGYSASVLFVIQMEGMHVFKPNDPCHAAFGETLRLAAEKGVNVLAYECSVTADSLELAGNIPIDLK